MNVRVRGIYATALTRLFVEAGHGIVEASPPIRERFDAEFETGAADVAIKTGADRQGVSITGATDAVEAGTAIVADSGRDAFVWRDPTPRGAVFDALVTDTRGGGAIVTLGEDRTGYVPFDAVDGYVDEGDGLRVQVTEPRPPWDAKRPALDADLVAPGVGGLVRLVADADGTVDAPDRETGRLAELLSTDVPDGWGIGLGAAATDASLDALDDALSRAVDRATALGTAVDDPSPDGAPREIARPLSTTWCWFGRETRFALDERRREVTPTMPGHHRIKAADERASTAVDFVEAISDPDRFPFDAVAETFGPEEGGRVTIEHGKPAGRVITLGRGDVTDVDPEGAVTVRREMTAGGTYDALDAERTAGDVAITTITEGRWWYPTVYRDETGTRKGTYVNVCTPVEIFPDAVRYVDLHVDVVKHADGRVERVDDDELDAAVAAGTVSERLAEKTRDVAASIERALGG